MEYKILVIYIAILNENFDDVVHLSKMAQIAYLKVDKALTKVFSEYINFADIFLPKLVIKVSKHIKNNNHAIKLVDT